MKLFITLFIMLIFLCTAVQHGWGVAGVADVVSAPVLELEMSQFHIWQKGFEEMRKNEVLDKWRENLSQLKALWSEFTAFKKSFDKQASFVKQLTEAHGDPRKIANTLFNEIDQEIFSPGGLVSSFGSVLKKFPGLKDWEEVLRTLFEPINARLALTDDGYLIDRAEKYKKQEIRLQRRSAVEKAYLEARQVEKQAEEIEVRWKAKLKKLQIKIQASGSSAELQKLSACFAVAAAGIEALREQSKNYREQFSSAKSLADNRDSTEDALIECARRKQYLEAVRKTGEATERLLNYRTQGGILREWGH